MYRYEVAIGLDEVVLELSMLCIPLLFVSLDGIGIFVFINANVERNFVRDMRISTRKCFKIEIRLG